MNSAASHYFMVRLVLAEPSMLIRFRRILFLPLLVDAIGVHAGIFGSVSNVPIQLAFLGACACPFTTEFVRSDRHWAVLLLAATTCILVFGILVDVYHGLFISSVRNSDTWVLYFFWSYRVMFLFRIWLRTANPGLLKNGH